VVIDAGEAGEFTVGPVREGERMRPLGMDGTKKLADLLADEKVPRRQRHGIPVVRDGERVVWLAGVRMSDEYKVGPHTTRAVRLTWRTG
jgi:tRNA(Ile)-lysidine synthase